jgi:NACHT domain
MHQCGQASLAMYYYDFREDRKQDLRGLLSSVLVQLYDQSESYYDILSRFYSKYHNGARENPSDDDLARCLRELLNLSGPPPVYLIIDGLDECPSTPSSLSSPREEVLSLLEDLVEAQLPNLWICVTSRPEVDIRTILEPLAFRSVSLHDEPGQKEDIKMYIESVISTNKMKYDWSSEQKQLVVNTLIESADGL